MTPDPGGMGAAHPGDPQTWNMYAYVRNNPTTLNDPTGLEPADAQKMAGNESDIAADWNPFWTNGAGSGQYAFNPLWVLDQEREGGEYAVIYLYGADAPQTQLSATASGQTVTITAASFDPETGMGTITTETRTGNHPFRDNNPGDVEAGAFANAHGAIGNDKGIAIFPNSDVGFEALHSLLSGPAYNGLGFFGDFAPKKWPLRGNWETRWCKWPAHRLSFQASFAKAEGFPRCRTR